MPSKQIVDRQKSALAVISAGETHSSAVADELAPVLSPYLQKSEKLPDVALLARLVARALDDAGKRMVAADEAHIAELADDAAPREARDSAATALYDEIVDLRDWLKGLYGAGALRPLGFSSDTPRDPVALERFAGEVMSALGKATLPKPLRKGVKWDPGETLEKLGAMRAALNTHLKDVAREVREAQATLRTKNDALAAYDERFGRAASFLVGLFNLAGETALADRVRPSARRPGQTEVDAAGEPEPAAPPA